MTQMAALFAVSASSTVSSSVHGIDCQNSALHPSQARLAGVLSRLEIDNKLRRIQFLCGGDPEGRRSAVSGLCGGGRSSSMLPSVNARTQFESGPIRRRLDWSVRPGALHEGAKGRPRENWRKPSLLSGMEVGRWVGNRRCETG
jgi:hypothetical protein